jgi:nucleoside-diphosphate-sugar epimerase
MSHVVLLTGASGALGTPLLDALAARDGVARVYALVHRTPVARPGPKVRAWHGDVTAGPHLGLTPAQVRELANEVTCVIHAAADARFLADLETTRAVNVGGTRHVLELAQSFRRLDRFCYSSTVYVAGRRTGPVLEAELEHAAGFVNPYEQAKHESEQLVRQWMTRLPILVARLSTVIDGIQGGRLGAIHQAMRLMYSSLAPMVPGRGEHLVDLVSLDYAVRAVAELSLPAFRPGLTCHVCGGADALGLAELLDLTMSGFLRHRPAWRKRAIAMPALVDLETFELFRRSVEEVGDAMLRQSAAVIGSFAPQLAFPKVFDDENARHALAGSGIRPDSIRDTVSRTVQYLVETGWAASDAAAAVV